MEGGGGGAYGPEPYTGAVEPYAGVDGGRYGVAAGLGDVVHDGVAEVASVVNDEIAEAEHALGERSRDGHVLDIA